MEKQENLCPRDRAFTSHCRVSCVPPPPLIPDPTITSPKPHNHLSHIPPPLLYTCISLSGTKDPCWPPHHNTGPARAGQGWQPQGSRHKFGDPTAPSCPSTRRNQAGHEALGLLYPNGTAGAVTGPGDRRGRSHVWVPDPQRSPLQASRPPMAPGLCQPASPQHKWLQTAQPRPARGRPSLIFPGQWPRQGAPPLGAAPRARPRLSDGSHKGKAPSNPPGARGTCTLARPGLEGSEPASAEIRGSFRAALK